MQNNNHTAAVNINNTGSLHKTTVLYKYASNGDDWYDYTHNTHAGGTQLTA